MALLNQNYQHPLFTVSTLKLSLDGTVEAKTAVMLSHTRNQRVMKPRRYCLTRACSMPLPPHTSAMLICTCTRLAMAPCVQPSTPLSARKHAIQRAIPERRFAILRSLARPMSSVSLSWCRGTNDAHLVLLR
ncbi:MAG: hypothetical protein CM15mP92_2740 [Halieaceae bacterium]|nr:MAG: hypothetical protein CM15mP92_2740 [Halieaceae bacterium]